VPEVSAVLTVSSVPTRQHKWDRKLFHPTGTDYPEKLSLL